MISLKNKETESFREQRRLDGGVSILALALGACAVGALAIGAIAVGRLAINKASIRRLEIDQLVIRDLKILNTSDTSDNVN